MRTEIYPPAPRLAFHPYLPERLGYRTLLRLLNPELERLISQVKPFTLMSARNLSTIFREGTKCLRRGVPGAFVEIGVHRGGSAAVLAQIIKNEPERHLHLFDRWGDLPEPTEEDGFRREQYSRDAIPDKLAQLRDDPPLDSARQVLEDVVQFPKHRLHYHAGWYDETMAGYSGGPIAFASLDCDYYDSVRQSLTFLDRHASIGATIIADDYGGWPGAKKAIDEWIAQTKRSVRIQALPTGPAVLRLG